MRCVVFVTRVALLFPIVCFNFVDINLKVDMYFSSDNEEEQYKVEGSLRPIHAQKRNMKMPLSNNEVCFYHCDLQIVFRNVHA